MIFTWTLVLVFHVAYGTSSVALSGYEKESCVAIAHEEYKRDSVSDAFCVPQEKPPHS